MIYDKEWANRELRFAIAVLQGKRGWLKLHCQKNRVLLALSIRNSLYEAGFWWQAQKLSIWIGKTCKKFTAERSEAEALPPQSPSPFPVNLHGVDGDE